MKTRILFKLITATIWTGLLVFLSNGLAKAQHLDVAYVVTPDSIVERMLDMAKVGPGDYVIDLGCGDGRINIAAAKRGALGYGVDLDPQRVVEARKNAEQAGVADKIVFEVKNVYETDFSRASVIAMYLFPSINVKLRPAFLSALEPGTRIVSHDFGMDEWKPDLQVGRMENHAVLLWIVPAKVEGNWHWEIDGTEFEMSIVQNFQEIEINIQSGNRELKVTGAQLSGKRIEFIVVDSVTGRKLACNGEVTGKRIEGIVQIHAENGSGIKNWSADMTQ